MLFAAIWKYEWCVAHAIYWFDEIYLVDRLGLRLNSHFPAE
jgi:hypothetical protein